MIIKKKLQDVYESIQAVNPKQVGGFSGNPMKGILPYALKSLIEEHPDLEEEFKRRADYYPNLAKDQKYLDFITGLHKKMKEIQSRIDPSKLPPAEKQRLKRPKHTPFEDEKDGVDRFWIEMKELHGDLTKPEKWWYLGDEGMPFTVKDSVTAPWSHVLDQYGIVLNLMLQAFDSGALEETKANFDMCVEWKEDMRTLKEMFEKPVHQLHVDAFEHLQHNMVAPEWMGDDEKDVERAKGYADRVCKDLMLFLDEHEASAPTTRKGKKKIVKYLGEGRLKFGQDEYLLPKKVFYARLSDKVYALSQQVGHNIPCETLYAELTGKAYNHTLNWRQIYDAIVKANKWAGRQKPKLPKLFLCTKDGVTRLV